MNTIANDLRFLLGGTVPRDGTLGDIYVALKEGSAKCSFFHLIEDQPFFLCLDDGMTTRSVIRADKKTYHAGELLETIAALKDCSIPLGKMCTSLDVPLRDTKDASEWIVHVTLYSEDDGSDPDDSRFHIRLVECTLDAFYEAQEDELSGETWVVGEDTGDLLKFLCPSRK